PPGVRSARYDVTWASHFRNTICLWSAVTLIESMQDAPQLVNCRGFPIGRPVWGSIRIVQKSQARPPKDWGSSTEYRNPSSSVTPPLILAISDDENMVVMGPPFRSRLTRLSPDSSFRTYETRCPLGDQSSIPIELFSSVSKSFRAFSPSGVISQISRSPNRP